MTSLTNTLSDPTVSGAGSQAVADANPDPSTCAPEAVTAATAEVLTTAWAATDPAAPAGRRLRDAAAAVAAWHAAARAPARAALADLAARAASCRREQEEAAAAGRALRAQIDRFRADVRRRVIKAVNDGHICREGANTALADWGMPALRGEHDATVEVGIEVVVAAVDDEGTEQAARQAIADECAQLGDDEVDALYDIDIDDVRPLDEHAPPDTRGLAGNDGRNAEDSGEDSGEGRVIAYRVKAALRAHVTVIAADEDEAADAAVELVSDRAQALDRVTAANPRCTGARQTIDGYLYPDWD